MPRIARVLLQQTHSNQGTSFSNINLTSKTYNGEWAFVGESVRQPGQFALGEFRHPALREYHPLSAEAVRAAGMTWKKDPPSGPVTESPLPTTNDVRCCANGAGSSGAKPKSEATLKPSELSSTCPPQQQRSMRIQTRAFKCRQAIRKGSERYRSQWGGEDARR